MVFVVSPAWAGGDSIKIKEVVVSASRYEEELTSVPAHVTVITEENIENSTAQNIPDLLRTVVGINVNDIAGNKRSITVDIRGFGATAPLNTLVLVDGRRVNQADLSGTDWIQIPIERVERIEIIRGGRGSVLYGDNAAGGVINIITKEGTQFEAGADTAIGSYDTYKGNAYFSGATDNLSYFFSANLFDSDGYRDNSGTEAKDLGIDLNYYSGDVLKINFSSGYHKDYTRLPGALKVSDFNAGLSRTNTITPDNFADVEDYYFKLAPEVYFLDDSLIKIDLSYRMRSSLSFYSYTGGNFMGDTEIETITLSPQVLLKNNLGGVGNSLTFGFDYQSAEENILNNSIFWGTRSIGTFKLEKESYGFYINDDIKLIDSLLFSGGYRNDRANYTLNPSTLERISMDEDLYTAGVNYNFYDKSYAYISFSKSFRYPVLDELFSFSRSTINTRLNPQKSDNYEVGVRYYFMDSNYAQANLFRINTENEIFFNSTLYANVNLDGISRRDGVELSFSTQPAEWLMLNGSYTYLKTKIKEGMFKRNDIPNVPKSKLTLEALFSPVRDFSMALNGVYTGERRFQGDFANAYDEQADHIVVNSKLKYRWNDLTAFLDINNLFDEEYSEFGVIGGFPVENAFFPSPKRNFLAGLSVDF